MKKKLKLPFIYGGIIIFCLSWVVLICLIHLNLKLYSSGFTQFSSYPQHDLTCQYRIPTQEELEKFISDKELATISQMIENIKRDEKIQEKEIIAILGVIGKSIVEEFEISSKELTDSKIDNIISDIKTVIEQLSISKKYTRTSIINILSGYLPKIEGLRKDQEIFLITLLEEVKKDGILTQGEARAIKRVYLEFSTPLKERDKRTPKPIILNKDKLENMKDEIEKASTDGKYTGEEIMRIINIGENSGEGKN